jgi:two-component system, OmpR family, phosphate regulon sensor histidine kinase PhoR
LPPTVSDIFVMDVQPPALLPEVLDALPDPVIMVDGRKVVTFANRSARTAWPGLTDQTPISFTLRTPDLIDAIDRVIGRQEAVAKGTITERLPVERYFEFDAVGLSASAQASPRTAPAVMIVFRDLTEARRLEAMRVDFVANASHELRTPLASLLGFIETLQGPARNDPTAQSRFLSIMREQGRRMARLIDDLLSLSRVEMSEHRRPVDPVDMGAIVRQTVDTLRPLAEERQVTIETMLPSGPLTVTGDHDELMRVAENLIENAIKYGQAGKRIEVRLETGGKDAGEPCESHLSIRDFGPGIPPEHLPRLTERFYRVDASMSRETGGTGLGLAIVKHIINRHRGRLAIESELGTGSTFHVYLALRD